MKTAVVILNWNGEGFLRKFVPPLLDSLNREDASLIVADNASSDGSLKFLEQEHPEVGVMRFDRNYGFTGGYNKALFQIDAEYFVLLNSDVEVPPDWLYPLVEWMDLHDDCAACGPKLLDWNARDSFEYAGAAGGFIDRFGYPFCKGRVLSKREKDKGQYDLPDEVLWASGACLMVRASVFRELGGLD